MCPFQRKESDLWGKYEKAKEEIYESENADSFTDWLCGNADSDADYGRCDDQPGSERAD